MGSVSEQLSAMLWNITNRLSVIDIIDVLLLAFLIYTLINSTKQTRVSQILKGVVVMLVAWWFSDVLGMRTIHALLGWIINAGPVMLLVLFQPEIRRILEELGNNSILDAAGRRSDADSTDEIVDELVLALTRMSRRRVGALIVIENKTRLDEVMSTGTKVDGVVSQPLLENIFEPNTPLHDGAVVIRGDRVVSAACLLRLSDSTGVGRDLGTRHRAGLGVSEVSDATVFIVSEETGIISKASGGRLVRHLDETSLRQILHELYNKEEKDSRLSASLLYLTQRRRSAHDERKADKEA